MDKIDDFLKKYKKQTGETRILLIWLILNGYDLKNVRYLEVTDKQKDFGLQLKKTYGITKDHIDLNEIYKEIEQIQSPTVCSIDTYEYYADSNNIYLYAPEDKESPLVINDLSVISKTMVITEHIVLSDNIASSINSGKCINGFPYFMEYVIRNIFKLDKWEVNYQNSVFSIKYDGKELYSAVEIDKTSTYKIVIYLIKKAAEKLGAVPDNYICDKYTRKESLE